MAKKVKRSKSAVRRRSGVVRLPARQVPVMASADVVVVGGGPGGWPAAVAAARRGADVLLLERYGMLGGMATNGLVGSYLYLTAAQSSKPVVGGLMRELHERLKAVGGVDVSWRQCSTRGSMPFDVEAHKHVLDEWATTERRLAVLLHCWSHEAIVRDGRVEAVVAWTKSGPQAFAGKVFIDATGDGDVAAAAGAPFTLGRPQDGRPMAMGSMFHVGHTRAIPRATRSKVVPKIRRQLNRRGLTAYGTGPGGKNSTVQPDEVGVNATRAGGDATHVVELTAAELKTRQMAWEMVEIYRKVIPGWRDAFLSRTPMHVGVRETRQITGDYVITGGDLVAGRKFDDSIAACGYWIDIHCPLGRAIGGEHVCHVGCPSPQPCPMFKNDRRDLRTREGLWPPKGDYFGIPYRSLTPQKLRNVLVSGRCISGDHEAMSAFRVMAQCVAIGEAAGTAAAMAARQRSPDVRRVDPKALRRKLVAGGAFVGEPENAQ